ncbi:MAG: hypothetical protein OYM47_19930 [Gemmatimonadota bacterium]|nr:hypothetical protein [Gemmatimonadota bacterium]
MRSQIWRPNRIATPAASGESEALVLKVAIGTRREVPGTLGAILNRRGGRMQRKGRVRISLP